MLCVLSHNFLDQRHQHLLNDLSVQSVLAMEMNHIFVMLEEDVLAVHRGVVVSEEAIDIHSVLVGDAVKLVSLHLGEMLDDFGRDDEGLCTIFARVEELESSFF